MEQTKLPNGKLSYILAILSCTFFLFGGITLVFALSSYLLARKSEKIYRQNPTAYSNYKQIKKVKIIAIIGIILNVIIAGIAIWTLATIGWDTWSDEFIRRWNEGLQNSGR